MTGIASLVFFFLDPSKAAPGAAEVPFPATDNATEPLGTELFVRAESTASGGGANSYPMIYR